MKNTSIGLFLLIILFSCNKQSSESLNRRFNFDDNWKFQYGNIPNASDIAFDDSQWQTLDIPHDWSVEIPFKQDSVKGKAIGQTVGGIGWYRKKFTLKPEDENKLLQLYFEGIYMESEVWLNGQKINYHPSGYTSFFCDITSHCNPPGEENTLAVKVMNEGWNSRWYAGSGIYRHVWMITTDQLYLDTWGLFVSTPSVSEEKATVHIAADIINSTGKEESFDIHIQIKDTFKSVIKEEVIRLKLSAGEKKTIHQDLEVIKPALWSVDSPALYGVIVSVRSGKQLRDELSTTLGIRSIAFSAEEGFLLNGNPLKLKGGCVHHDNGLLGAASIDRAEERKVELLKANGFNAVRCSHNPPAEKFLDACDRLGLFVIDEAFDQWQKKKNPQDYHRFFDECSEKDMSSMVLRDRNHPSIIMWSIGNEIEERADSSGVAIANKLKAIIHQFDQTRPVTAAINDFWENRNLKWKDSEKAFATLDVGGYNYMHWEYEKDIKTFPERIIYGSESTAMERAINWDYVEQHPSIIGDFIWTAIDYIGESGIGHALQVKNGEIEPPMFLGWPWFNAWCGDIDLCGDKKPQSLFRDVLWNESRIEMAVHVPIPSGYHEKISYWGWPEEYPSWNWSGNENKSLQVKVYTRYPAVRLYLNDQLLEEKDVSKDIKTKYTALFQVKYQPGMLKAVGVESGKEKESTSLTTTGKPAKIRLTADRNLLRASVNDLSYIKIELVDEKGQVVPDQDCTLRLSVSGAGKIAASGNASPTDMESFRSLTPKTFRGKALAIIRPAGDPGTVTLKVEADGFPKEEIVIKTI